MTVRLSVVYKDHPVCDPYLQSRDELDREPQAFLDEVVPAAAHVAILAKDGERLVGFVRLTSGYGLGHTEVRAYGTWVAVSHRRQGLALRMWSFLLRRTWSFPLHIKRTEMLGRFETVRVTCLNKGSANLMQKIAQRFKRVRFHIKDNRPS